MANPEILHVDISGLYNVGPKTNLESDTVWATLFICTGYEYFVHKFEKYWTVSKFDGGSRSETYRIEEKRKLHCDCRAGRMHRNCRHKEMVRLTKSLKGI